MKNAYGEWPASGEIDIVEARGKNSNVQGVSEKEHPFCLFVCLFVCEKVNKAKQQDSSGQKHNFASAVRRLFKWYHYIVSCKRYGS